VSRITIWGSVVAMHSCLFGAPSRRAARGTRSLSFIRPRAGPAGYTGSRRKHRARRGLALRRPSSGTSSEAGCSVRPRERGSPDPGSQTFYLQISFFQSGGTRIRTRDTMIFSHMQKPLGMRKTRVAARISVQGEPLDTSCFCTYCCATVDMASSLFGAPEAERASLLASLVY
jgi:hypothetical protein